MLSLLYLKVCASHLSSSSVLGNPLYSHPCALQPRLELRNENIQELSRLQQKGRRTASLANRKKNILLRLVCFFLLFSELIFQLLLSLIQHTFQALTRSFSG